MTVSLRQDLNPAPTVYKTVALPDELQRLMCPWGWTRTNEATRTGDLQSPAIAAMRPKDY